MNYVHNINAYLDLVQIKIHDKYHIFKKGFIPSNGIDQKQKEFTCLQQIN
jgi:hypothetical protein